MNNHDLYRLIRNELSRSFVVYSFFAKRHGACLVSKNTELMIEGFPRCANSFFEAAVRIRATHSLRIAHHTHAISSVKRGILWRVPCVVLLRPPVDAIVSFLEEGEQFSSPNVLLREYVIFYRGINNLRENVLLLSFDDVTQKTNRAVDLVAAFAEFDIREPMSALGSAALKSRTEVAQKRVGITPAYRRAISSESIEARRERRSNLRNLIHDRSHGLLLRQAEDIYKRLVTHTSRL